MKNFLSSVRDEAIRKKIPVSNNHAEHRFSVVVHLHPSFLSNPNSGSLDSLSSSSSSSMAGVSCAKRAQLSRNFCFVILMVKRQDFRGRGRRREPGRVLTFGAQVKI